MDNKRITRFPPEPNGYIHLGHLKAMRFDFDLHTGPNDYCVLRMDDTNPEAEKQEYVDAIIEDVKWLGYKFKKLTYTSDYFKELYDFAVILIKNNLAYVDFTDADKMKEMRHSGTESEYRNMSCEWHLTEFENMKNRKYDENAAVLRLKIDMQNDNHTLRDPVAYRIKYTPHYRTKDAYCIYPSYDYSHGIVDALENITDSYCTTEFIVRREQYYWTVLKLKELGINNISDKANVVEFGRLNVEGVMLSKRKIIPLIENKVLSGFDDPRLYTIRGLRRRGFTPEILKNIVYHVNMDRNESVISQGLIEHELRTYFDKCAPRAFAVMNPIKVVNDDLNADYNHICIHPNHPTDISMLFHETNLTKEVYIEKSDFREIDSSDYFRLAPNKTIRYRYADFVKYKSHDNNEIKVINIVPENTKKVRCHTLGQLCVTQSNI